MLYYPCFSQGVPSAAEIIDFPAETKESEITLKWKEAEHNGSPITQYSVYRRTVREDGTSLEWKKIGEIKDPLSLEVVVKVEKGKEYEFVVTATNKFGEGGKEGEKIRKIQVLGGMCIQVSLLLCAPCVLFVDLHTYSYPYIIQVVVIK